jgi:hypothetical protein
MGMRTARPGGVVRSEDAAVATNYLTEAELQVLTRIVSLYIEFAELQALERKQMTMQDWIIKLDELLRISGREILANAETISPDSARRRAEREYARYRALEDSKPRAIDVEFERVIKQLKTASRAKKRK